MPVVNFVIQAENVNIRKSFPTPKRMSDLNYWWKTVRKAVPEIPVLGMPNKDGRLWRKLHEDVTTTKISWTLESNLGDRAYVVIAR